MSRSVQGTPRSPATFSMTSLAESHRWQPGRDSSVITGSGISTWGPSPLISAQPPWLRLSSYWSPRLGSRPGVARVGVRRIRVAPVRRSADRRYCWSADDGWRTADRRAAGRRTADRRAAGRRTADRPAAGRRTADRPAAGRRTAGRPSCWAGYCWSGSAGPGNAGPGTEVRRTGDRCNEERLTRIAVTRSAGGDRCDGGPRPEAAGRAESPSPLLAGWRDWGHPLRRPRADLATPVRSMPDSLRMSEIAEIDGSGETFACCSPSSITLVASTNGFCSTS